MSERFLVVILNGPSNCGKDTIISRLMHATTPYMILNHKHIMGWHEKMVMPLRDMVCGLFGLNGYQYETMKDDPILPNGVTPREAIKHLDIHWSRPLFGEDFLGNLLVAELKRNHRRARPFEFKDQVNIHFVDAGVEPEFQALKAAYGDRVKVIRVYRTDLEFDDTREWLSQCNGIVHNHEGKVDEAVDKVLLFINEWLERIDDKIDAGTTAGVSEEGAKH